MYRKLGALLLAVCMTIAAGCGASKKTEDPPVEIVSPLPTVTPAFVDSAGREVQLPADIKRVAPSGALAQIVLFSISPDKLVGLSGKWTDSAAGYLDQKYLSLPIFGQFYNEGDLNKEALSAADPQLIIDIGEVKDSTAEDMDALQEQLGIPAIFIEATLEGMPECYALLGEALGMQAEAQALADACRDIQAKTASVMEAVGDGKKTLLYCVGDTGTNVIAKGSYHAEAIDMVADNAAVIDNPSAKGSGSEVSMEQILLWDPDVIVFDPGSIFATAGDDPAWAQLSAISSGNYYEAPNGPYNWLGFPPSVNRLLGLLWLCQTLYPDASPYDLQAETSRFYQMFYHVELSDEQYAAILKNAGDR